MIFDKLCGFCEKGHLPPDIVKLVVLAKLFDFPVRFHEVAPRGSEEYSRAIQSIADFWQENFFLPFQVVTVEDTASLVILADTQAGARGLSADRVFLECRPLRQGISKEFATSMLDDDKRAQGYSDKHYVILWGGLSELEYANKAPYSSQVRAGGGVVVSEDAKEGRNGLLHRFVGHELMENVAGAAKNSVVAIEELMYFNSPDRFIVERMPAKMKQRGKDKKIPRSPERPHYVLMHAKEIRKTFGISEPTGRTVSPHERRAHPRTYRHERFAASGLQGKTVIIRETWVGDTEKVVGNTRYRVLVDL